MRVMDFQRATQLADLATQSAALAANLGQISHSAQTVISHAPQAGGPWIAGTLQGQRLDTRNHDKMGTGPMKA
jgi:hypothetical protein